MFDNSIILNESERRQAKSQIDVLENALSSTEQLTPLLEGLPPALVAESTRALKNRVSSLKFTLNAYELASTGANSAPLIELSNRDPGLSIIVARIIKKLTQKELARLLGVRPQQVQRWEAERYRSISLERYQVLALLLGVQLEANVDRWKGRNLLLEDVDPKSFKKVLSHGKKCGWFEREGSADELKMFLAENRISFLSRAKLRAGLSPRHDHDDVLLHSWRARVYARAKEIIKVQNLKFDFMNYSWLTELPTLTTLDNGPERAVDLLLSKGIVTIFEPHIEGLRVDGAAFEINGVPVIALTLLHDRLDNFWFTLMHEIGHIILHFDVVKNYGLFDLLENETDELEEIEANKFASDILIPEEIWNSTSIRLSKSPKHIEEFAKRNNVHPSIVYGRLQKERNDYTIFSHKLVRGTLRQKFF